MKAIQAKTVALGIDPGLKGGFALVGPQYLAVDGGDPYRAAVLEAGNMPLFKDEAKTMTSNPHVVHVEVLKEAMANMKAMALHRRITFGVIVEKAQAMPKQGVVAMFNYGFGYGQVIATATLVCGGHRVWTVAPAIWKRDLGLTGQDKRGSRKLATQIFGDSEQWPRAKDDGVAEAALIAYWRLIRLAQMRQYQKAQD